jgi:microcystin-dependent protein
MSGPFVGEIRMFAGNFAPVGWAFCEGQLIPISENDTLFNLIGTTYGGDGQETFALPDLSGRLPMHQGSSQGITHIIGEAGGVESVTLTTSQIPQHNHSLLATTDPGSSTNPDGKVPANSQGAQMYIEDVATAALPSQISPVGGSQPHDNLQPYLAIRFIISLFGVFPTQT